MLMTVNRYDSTTWASRHINASMRKIARSIWLVIATLGALAMTFAQVSVEDAKSNISGWLRLMGFEKVPESLTSVAADRWLTAIGFALLAISVAVLVWWWSRGKSEAKKLHSTRDLPTDAVRDLVTAKLSESAIVAYVRSSRLVAHVDSVIATDLNQQIASDVPAHVYLEEARAFGMETIGDLDRALRANGNAAQRMAHLSRPEGASVPQGYCLTYLFMVLGARLGEEAYFNLIKDFKWTRTQRGFVKEVVEFYKSSVETA